MPLIRINREARAIIRSRANLPFKDTALNITADGSADIPLDDEILEHLESLRFEGESYSDLIIRVVSTYNKPQH